LHKSCSIVPIRLQVGPKLVETTTTIATGAESYAFIDTSFA
jgi:hypothetical protein